MRYNFRVNVKTLKAWIKLSCPIVPQNELDPEMTLNFVKKIELYF